MSWNLLSQHATEGWIGGGTYGKGWLLWVKKIMQLEDCLNKGLQEKKRKIYLLFATLYAVFKKDWMFLFCSDIKDEQGSKNCRAVYVQIWTVFNCDACLITESLEEPWSQQELQRTNWGYKSHSEGYPHQAGNYSTCNLTIRVRLRVISQLRSASCLDSDPSSHWSNPANGIRDKACRLGKNSGKEVPLTRSSRGERSSAITWYPLSPRSTQTL